MANSPMRYDQFVRALLDVVRPVLPEGVSPELSFSGSMDAGRKPGPDMAVVGGRRAIAFLRTAALAYGTTGVSPDDYDVTRSLVTDVPLVAHAAYARNLRRWEGGTLPRKRRARADLVVVATCWLAGWEDGRDAGPDQMAEAWARFVSFAGAAPDDPSDRAAIAAALWRFSAASYEASLAARRARCANGSPLRDCAGSRAVAAPSEHDSERLALLAHAHEVFGSNIMVFHGPAPDTGSGAEEG